MGDHQVIIVGAGLSGLACAGALKKAGVDFLVLERSWRPGGRCSFKEGFDIGPAFLHGNNPEFLAWIEENLPGSLVPGWPMKIEGRGTPCLPAAFQSWTKRYALRDGLGTFASALAWNLPITLNYQVESIHWDGTVWTVASSTGETHRAPALILTMALEQTQALLAQAQGDPFPRADVLKATLGLFSSVPCLTLMVSWGEDFSGPLPEWDVYYPEIAQRVLMISQESRKRPAVFGGGDFLIQARPLWSSRHMEDPKDLWAEDLLAEAVGFITSSPVTPARVLTHRWKYARLESYQHLNGPWGHSLGGGRFLGAAGDLFSPEGGLQGAWMSGRSLAADVLKCLS